MLLHPIRRLNSCASYNCIGHVDASNSYSVFQTVHFVFKATCCFFYYADCMYPYFIMPIDSCSSASRSVDALLDCASPVAQLRCCEVEYFTRVSENYRLAEFERF